MTAQPQLAQAIGDFNPSSDFTPPPNWYQGRTIYGGLSTALALQCALQAAPPNLPPLKSAQILFVGPASGSLRFVPQLLRQGKSVTSIAVDCLSGSDVALRAAYVFATPRTSRIQHELSQRPSVDVPDCYQKPPDHGSAPAALGNFDLRFAGSSLPASGAERGEFVAWVRHRDATGVDPAVALLAIADALPPAAMACFSEFAPVSTMQWTVDLPQPATSGEWFLLRSTSQQAGNGYSFQTMEIWDERGNLVLCGNQTVAIFA
ncbi:MAG: thioesterase family protein [Caldilineaceae bacterium]